jgi:hypothetical protein
MSKIEDAFDLILSRDLGGAPPYFLDNMTDQLARCETEAARDMTMRSILDRLFHTGTINRKINGLSQRPELNGSAVEVLGPSLPGSDGAVRYPVRVRNTQAAFDGEQLKLQPRNLVPMEPLVPDTDDEAEAGEEEGDDADDAAGADKNVTVMDEVCI